MQFELAQFHERFRSILVVGIFLILLGHIFVVRQFAFPVLACQDRKRFVAGIFVAFGFFVAGTVAGYAWALPAIIAARLEYVRQTSLMPPPEWRLYAIFAAKISFGAGLLCELPPLAWVLGHFRLIHFRWLPRTRPGAYVVILAVSAVEAPAADPFTFVALAVPLLALYEACLGIVWFSDRSRAKTEELPG